jgi:general secretion pathway protein F
MAQFKFRASDAAGEISTGKLDADSARAARAELRDRGLWVLEINEAQGANQPGLLSRRRWKASRLANLTRQLAGLLGAGLTLTRALNAMIQQETLPEVRAVLTRVQRKVEAGSSLSEAMAGEPEAFSSTYRAVIAAGESAGDLPGVANRLADFLEARHALQLKVLTALAYPAIVCVVALLVVVGLLVYVVPQVVAVFEHTKTKLPLLTRLMIGLSGLLREGWWLWLALLGGGTWGIRRLWRQPAFRLPADRRLLSVPVIGPTWLAIDSARAASTLAMLVSAGVPLLQALETVRKTLSNTALQADMAHVAEEVREGVRLSRALARSGRFPPMLVQLIDNGEATGRLAEMLEHAARTQQSEVERRLMLLTTLLEPLLVLGMGLFVLLIVLAVMMPIIEINQLIK